MVPAYIKKLRKCSGFFLSLQSCKPNSVPVKGDGHLSGHIVANELKLATKFAIAPGRVYHAHPSLESEWSSILIREYSKRIRKHHHTFHLSRIASLVLSLWHWSSPWLAPWWVDVIHYRDISSREKGVRTFLPSRV